MKKIFKIWSFVIILAFVFLIFSNIVLAAKNISNAPEILKNVVSRSGVPQQTIPKAAGSIIKLTMTTVSLAFFILMVYAGFKWMLAQGDEEKIKKARGTLVMATVGLVILVSSYAISTFLFRDIIIIEEGGGTGAPDDSPPVCCLDQVKAGSDDYLEVHFAHWTWRVTTQYDCEKRGNDPNDPNDVLYGGGTWEALECGNRKSDECAVWCETIWDDK